ncbi:hypothetical protein AAG570_010988 [Ranatra chinensis]|uniref:Uncharacterized protein n=1 Tax=Ranatra chinensis TaxID=642074 RepID=A0ABD0YJA2_9HEMI
MKVILRPVPESSVDPYRNVLLGCKIVYWEKGCVYYIISNFLGKSIDVLEETAHRRHSLAVDLMGALLTEYVPRSPSLSLRGGFKGCVWEDSALISELDWDSRAPQQFTGANSQPQAAARLTPQGEAQRRLQEIVQQKVIREQESRDTQRQQLRTYYQQQGIAIPVQGTALPVQGAFQLVQPTPGAFQFFQPQAHQLLGQPSQAYYTVGQQTEPEQVSYAQVQFGNTRQALAAEHREPKVQQEPRVVFTQPPQQVIYQVQRPTTTTEAPKAQPSPLPQQYLIETTKPQQVVSIPRERQPFVYFRPQATNREILAQFDQQQQEVPERPQAIPSRSSIYVSKASLGGAQKPVFLNAGGQGRVATPQGQRPLTQIEFKALTDAGFKVASQPVDAQDFLSTAYTTAPQRASLKRPNKRVPKPVPLSFEERQRLAQQGIRNLYKVETAESQNSPVTYVLALGKTNTESS